MTVTKGKFKEYVTQQRFGEYNMYEPRARTNTNLTKAEWLLCMKYYDELYNKHITSEDEAEINNMIEELQDEE